MSEQTSWLVSDAWRQTGLVAFAFIWIGVWYHRQRVAFEDRQPAKPDMPLHQAARYLARDSVWAANFPLALDGEWCLRTDRELMSKLMMGHVQGFGRFKPDRQMLHNGTDVIPPEFFRQAEWYSSHLVTKDPPTHMWRKSDYGGGVYINVMLNRKQVEDVWPRRSFIARLRGLSAIDRISRTVGKRHSYKAIFRVQDENYRRLLTGENPLSAIDNLFAEGANAARIS